MARDEPEYSKTIVCLANSRKMSGRCIAGKVYGGGKVGEWVRPVSERPHEEISEEERRDEGGERVSLLDIVTIWMTEHRPHQYQSENHLIDDRYYWVRKGRAGLPTIHKAVDAGLPSLWTNGFSSYSGLNDRVPLTIAATHTSSLALVRAVNPVLRARAEGEAFGNTKRSVRIWFDWKGTQYALKVTDPEVEKWVLSLPDGEWKPGLAYVCVSLGEPFNEYTYKLAAAVITPDQLDQE